MPKWLELTSILGMLLPNSRPTRSLESETRRSLGCAEECSSKGAARYLALAPFVDGTCVFGPLDRELRPVSVFFFWVT